MQTTAQANRCSSPPESSSTLRSSTVNRSGKDTACLNQYKLLEILLGIFCCTIMTMAYKIIWQLTAKLGSEILVLVTETNKKYQAYQAVCRYVLDCPSRFFCQELTEHFPEKIMKKLSKYDYKNFMDCILTNRDHTDFGCQRERRRS